MRETILDDARAASSLTSWTVSRAKSSGSPGHHQASARRWLSLSPREAQVSIYFQPAAWTNSSACARASRGDAHFSPGARPRAGGTFPPDRACDEEVRARGHSREQWRCPASAPSPPPTYTRGRAGDDGSGVRHRHFTRAVLAFPARTQRRPRGRNQRCHGLCPVSRRSTYAALEARVAWLLRHHCARGLASGRERSDSDLSRLRTGQVSANALRCPRRRARSNGLHACVESAPGAAPQQPAGHCPREEAPSAGRKPWAIALKRFMPRRVFTRGPADKIFCLNVGAQTLRRSSAHMAPFADEMGRSRSAPTDATQLTRRRRRTQNRLRNT